MRVPLNSQLAWKTLAITYFHLWLIFPHRRTTFLKGGKTPGLTCVYPRCTSLCICRIRLDIWKLIGVSNEVRKKILRKTRKYKADTRQMESVQGVTAPWRTVWAWLISGTIFYYLRRRRGSECHRLISFSQSSLSIGIFRRSALCTGTGAASLSGPPRVWVRAAAFLHCTPSDCTRVGEAGTISTPG